MMHRAVALMLMLASVNAYAFPSYEQIKTHYQSSDTLVLDRNGVVVQRVRTNTNVRQGQWTGLEDISPALKTAIVMSEDKRFWEHSGVDWRAVSAAAWANLWNQKTRGASTLSMQLVGLVDSDLRRNTGGRTVAQKLDQAWTAQVLERQWRKDQILEAYLNLVPLRGELVGIDALSQTLFNKAPHALDQQEAAIAAVLVRSPNASPLQVGRRACALLKSMRGSDSASPVVDCRFIGVFVQAALQRRAYASSEGIAPHFASRVLANMPKPSNVVHSSLSAPLQRFATEALQRQLRQLHGRHVSDGALVVLDNATGEVLAWVGSSGELSDSAEVDGVTALRQAGSTLKPFLYAKAIADKRLTAASLLEDSSAQIPTAGGLYIPQNYDHHFKGWVSVRTALASSLNVPAVRTLVMVSPDALQAQLVAAGLPLRENGDYYGYSLALGSPDVPLLGLANAYRTLANGGRYSPPVLTPGMPVHWRAALDPRAAFIVSTILSDSNARARTFGTDSILATRFWTAVKTGTSKDMRDNWAIGYSQRYTVGVWVGNNNGNAMWNVSGVSGAAPAWAAVMAYLHRNLPSRAPAPPAGVELHRTQFADQLEPARDEWYLQGTEQTVVSLNTSSANRLQAAPKIVEPKTTTIVALDPDIPPARQKLIFKAIGAPQRWTLDGKALGSGNQLEWLPWPGRHLVELRDAANHVLDSISIEVRGAGLKVAKR